MILPLHLDVEEGTWWLAGACGQWHACTVTANGKVRPKGQCQECHGSLVAFRDEPFDQRWRRQSGRGSSQITPLYALNQPRS